MYGKEVQSGMSKSSPGHYPGIQIYCVASKYQNDGSFVGIIPLSWSFKSSKPMPLKVKIKDSTIQFI